MKAYKATYNMKCQDFTYEIGKTYTFDGKIELCSKGFHFCKNPKDVINYYSPYNSEFILLEIDVLGKVIQVLQAGKFSGKVYLTFRNGRRDGFGKDALENRLAWLDSMLPKGVKRTGHTKYNSAQIDRDASRTKGASM